MDEERISETVKALESDLQKVARDQLAKEHSKALAAFLGDKERSWQITEERIATIAASLKVLERLKKVNTNTDNCYLDAGIAVLRTMLEASQ